MTVIAIVIMMCTCPLYSLVRAVCDGHRHRDYDVYVSTVFIGKGRVCDGGRHRDYDVNVSTVFIGKGRVCDGGRHRDYDVNVSTVFIGKGRVCDGGLRCHTSRCVLLRDKHTRLGHV